jgi:hypothetical protein
MLQGSQAKSRKKFEQVIVNVCNVRNAWKQVAAETSPGLTPRHNPTSGQQRIEVAPAWAQEEEQENRSLV